jgi:hypothetical protein
VAVAEIAKQASCRYLGNAKITLRSGRAFGPAVLELCCELK